MPRTRANESAGNFKNNTIRHKRVIKRITSERFLPLIKLNPFFKPIKIKVKITLK